MTAGKDRSDDGVLLKSYWNGVPSDSVSEAIIIAERMERNDPILPFGTNVLPQNLD